MTHLLLSRRSLLSFLGLTATAPVVITTAMADAAKGLVEPRVEPDIMPNGVYDWNEYKHIITVTDDYIIAELREKSSNETFPIGTRLMFEGTIAPDGWTIVS